MKVSCSTPAPPEPQGSGDVLALEEVRFQCGPRTFGPASIRVSGGEIVGLLGPRGAGKASLLRALAGEIKIRERRMKMGQTDITGLDGSRRQEAGVFVCLRDRRRLRANRSLLEIMAAAMACDPKVIAIEEPFEESGKLMHQQAKAALVHACRNAGIGILISSHNARAMLDFVDRAYLFSEGRVVTEGTPEYLLTDRADDAL